MKACKDESIVACNLLVGSNLLLILESCILDDIDCSSLLFNIPINILMRWESSESDILKNGLAKMNWWERSFQQSFPTTYERLLLVSTDSNWRWMLSRCEDRPCRVWKESLSARSIVHAVETNHEFGSNVVHQLLVKEKEVLRTFAWGSQSGDSETQCYFPFNLSGLGLGLGLGSNVETIHHIQIFIISAIQRFLFVPKSTHRDPTRDSAERQHEKQH